ncbi:hypothetical protein SNE510_48570 [Streptomyces sp. NE5-10]|nr:hypothetical protein SNE510_48570 [Streptomyces sp. NE5-10]
MISWNRLLAVSIAATSMRTYALRASGETESNAVRDGGQQEGSTVSAERVRGGAVTGGRGGALKGVTAVAGKTPEPPPRPQAFPAPTATPAARDPEGPAVPGRPAPGSVRRSPAPRRFPVVGYARPARSRASTPARRAVRRSSRVKPAGARVSVVTPASA